MFAAEPFAKANGCVQPVATLSYVAPGVESFLIDCGRDEPLSVRCDGGECRAMK